MKTNLLKAIKVAAEEAIMKFPPKEEAGVVVETYCNWGLQYVCKAAGYVGFHDLNANEIAKKVAQDWAWALIEGEAAQKLALDGELVIAVCSGDPHGHVASVYADKRPMPTSGKWGNIKVPWVANVGKKNEIMGANAAFRDKPKFYVWVRDPDNQAV